MSVARKSVTVIAPGDLAATRRVPLSVEGWADWRLQQVQTSTGGTATAAVYGSVLPISDPRLTDTDPATNPHWELDASLTWAAPGTEGARSVKCSDNAWATILPEIAVTVTLTDFAVYFFGKER